MKKIIGLLLSVVILLSGLTGNVHAAETTLQQKAERLNKLSILKGDGKSYNLAGTLTRQEAATFIVRLLGVEGEVLRNKTQYSAVPFSDVKAKDWAAPYIGYCVQKGIINGYEDKTFRPTQKLELQAFAKLLLVSMGYVNNKDFVWNTTLEKAKTIQLVTDNEIALAKNNPFTRGDVIKLLDRILTMKNVQTEKEMFYNLLKAEGVTEQTLAEVGLVRRVGENKIELIKELSPGKFSIRFNTPPKVFAADNVIIVEEGGRNLKVKSIQATDLLSVYIIDTDVPTENTKYQILVRNVLDRNGAFFQEYKTEMIALRKGDLNTDLFRVNQVKVTGKKTVEVEFTHPVASDILNSNFFTIRLGNNIFAASNDIKVSASGNNKVRLTIDKSNFAENEFYKLTVSADAKSKLGVRINSGKEDSLLFQGKLVEEAKLEISSIELLDNTTLRVTVNKKVRMNIAEQVYSYYLTDNNKNPIAINKANVLENDDSEEQSILLKTDRSLSEGRNYNLRINQLYSEDRSESIIEKDYSFTAGIVGNSSFNLSYANQVDPYTLEFGFDISMDQKTATNPSNYYVRRETSGSTTTPSAVYYDYEHSRLLMFFDRPITERNSSNYILYAKKDIRGANGEQRRDDARITFTVSDPEIQKVKFEKVNYLGDNVVQIYFSEPIAKAIPNVDPDNYEIVEKDTQNYLSILGVRYIDGHRLVINTQNFDVKKTYVLKVKEILEYNGKTMVSGFEPIEIEKGNVVQ